MSTIEGIERRLSLRCMAPDGIEVADEVVLTAARKAAHRLARWAQERAASANEPVDVEDEIGRALVWAYDKRTEVAKQVTNARERATRPDTKGLEVKFLSDRMFQRLQKQFNARAEKQQAAEGERVENAEPHDGGHETDVTVHDAVRQALASLPEEYRQALDLVALHGRSLTQAAEECGVTRQGFKARYDRACRALSVALYGEQPPDEIRAQVDADLADMRHGAQVDRAKRRPSGPASSNEIDTFGMRDPFEDAHREALRTDKAYMAGVRSAERFDDLGGLDHLGYPDDLGYGKQGARVGERLLLGHYVTTGRPYLADSNWGAYRLREDRHLIPSTERRPPYVKRPRAFEGNGARHAPPIPTLGAVAVEEAAIWFGRYDGNHAAALAEARAHDDLPVTPAWLTANIEPEGIDHD